MVNKTHCKHGHEIAVVGRDKWGNCIACATARQANYNASVKGKNTRAKYNGSVKGKAANAAAAPIARANYNASVKGKNTNAAYQATPEYKIHRSAYQSARCREDIQYKIAKNLRSRLWKAIKHNVKTGSAVKDLGCDIDEIIEYFKPLFKEGMSWDNYGKWHIEHIIPLTAFDLTDPEQLKKACHFTNLQPLWGLDNIRKGGVKKTSEEFLSLGEK